MQQHGGRNRVVLKRREPEVVLPADPSIALVPEISELSRQAATEARE
jgi:hypothetical protein